MIERIHDFSSEEFWESAHRMGPDFSREMDLGFVPEVFVQRMVTLEKFGCVGGWYLKVDGTVQGIMVSTFVPDLYSSELVGQCLFWYVDPAHRGKRESLELLKETLNWLTLVNADRVHISHLHKAGSTGIGPFLQKQGFGKLETIYMKRISKGT